MATGTYSVQVSDLRKNAFVVVDGRACKILQLSFSDDECHLEVKDLFLGHEFKATFHQDDNVEAPNVEIHEYSLVNYDDGMLNLMTQEGTSNDNVSIPSNDLGAQIKENFDSGKDLLVNVISAMGEEQAIGVKEAPKGYH